MDANVTEPGDEYENLAESYVIFITENDVLQAGLPIYHIDRVIRETGAIFADEAHIIYVNSQIKDGTNLGRLMHDFSCTDAKDIYYKVLADRVCYFKENAKGVETMCRAMEEMRKEAAAEQNIITLLETLRNLMKNLGWTAEQAMTAMGISEAEKGLLIKKL